MPTGLVHAQNLLGITVWMVMAIRVVFGSFRIRIMFVWKWCMILVKLCMQLFRFTRLPSIFLIYWCLCFSHSILTLYVMERIYLFKYKLRASVAYGGIF